MTLEDNKITNGWYSVEVPDLKEGDVFLYDDEQDTDQGHLVRDIFKVNDNIIVEYIPEWTPVRNPGMYHYGMRKIRIKQ